MKMYDDSIGVGAGHSQVKFNPNGWTEGCVFTPHGIVSTYAQGDDTNVAHTRLDFVCAGKLYMRNFSGKRYSPRGIVTIAKRFAKEIIENAHVQPDAAEQG